MTRLLAALVVACAALLPASCGGETGAASGRVSVALSQDECEDYCLAALRATLYAEGESLPLGPALQVGCGEELSFAELPAGERVFVKLQAFDITGEALLAGASAALTVVAGGDAEARVALEALAAPELEALSPEPVVVASGGAAVTLRGTFGDALGRHAVELDGQAYASSRWSETTIDVTLPAGAVGDALVVRRCGVASAPLSLRVVGGAAGAAAATGAPVCQGLTARGLAEAGESEVLVAWSCADGSGTLQRLRLDDDLCPLDPGESWGLAAAPQALALLGERAYVAGASGLYTIDVGQAGARAERYAETPAFALAATAGEAYALTGAGEDAQLVRLGGGAPSPVAGIEASLVLTALAGSGERLYAAAHTAQGEGRLVSVSQSGAVAALSLTDDGARCLTPTAIAVARDGQTVALGCASGALAVWRVASETLLLVPDVSAQALAFDDPGDVLFASASGALTLVDLDLETAIHTFALSPRPSERPGLLLATSGHRLLLTGDAPLVVMTPYDPDGPCP